MLADYLKKLRESHDPKVSQRALAMKFEISNTAISDYENNRKQPSLEILKKYSDFFNVPYNDLIAIKYFMPEDNFNVETDEDGQLKYLNVLPIDPNSVFKVPLFSSVSAGLPSLVEPQEPLKMVDFKPSNVDITEKQNIISIVVNGESMNKLIPDKSYVFLDTKANIKSNDIIAFNIDGSDFGLKRFVEDSKTISLIPESYSPYPTLKFKKEDAQIREFNIIGKVISVSSDHLL